MNSSFSSPSSAADEGPVRSLKTKNHTAPSHLLPTQLVSAVLLDANAGTKVPAELSERELDLHILDLARLVKKAQDDGDPYGAKLWSKDLADAINSRSAAHQRRLNDEDPCYFSLMGELAAAQRTAP